MAGKAFSPSLCGNGGSDVTLSENRMRLWAYELITAPMGTGHSLRIPLFLVLDSMIQHKQLGLPEYLTR